MERVVGRPWNCRQDLKDFSEIQQGEASEGGLLVLILSDRQPDLRDIQEFATEAVIWRQLSHPNVLPFYGVFHLEDDRLCLVSPWMNNGNVVHFLESAPETKCVPLVSILMCWRRCSM